MKLIGIILKRTIALVILKVSSVLAAGSVVGVELWKSALVAAVVGIAEAAESLARAYVVDGHLSKDEINASFAVAAETQVPNSTSASPSKLAESYTSDPNHTCEGCNCVRI